MKVESVLTVLRLLVVERNPVRARAHIQALAANSKSRSTQDALEAIAAQLSPGGTLQEVRLHPQAQKHLHTCMPSGSLDDLILPPAVVALVTAIAAERSEAVRLAAHGLRPRRRVLLHGPPGTGKTSLAAALAHRLGLPLLTVRMATLIDSHMGCTSRALAQITEEMDRTPGVYFFDEVDMIAGARSSGSSGSEREYSGITSSLLQLLDLQTSASYLVAATNRVDHVDAAVRRRLDCHVELPLPGPEHLLRALEARISGASPSPKALEPLAAALAAAGASFADATRVAESGLRRMVLAGHGRVCVDSMLAELDAPQLPGYGGGA